ncbi:hypothetical protein M4D70_19045 [Brevibacillus borstelensis]|uniref:hypothetical protein n=1 Tax=Brevibacillus borstelensis TaxID=45462 RepID=UPI00203D8173|nr:hypothetical protein [Brevibacillus borstelensis]MCM3624327.1 hypothetical protein [Brevibacillus borstelensis]
MMRKRKPCICGKEAEYRIGTTEHSILESKIVANNVPHFFCNFCKRVSFDSNTNLVSVLINAKKQGLTVVDYKKRGGASMISYKIDVSEEMKKEIEQAIEDKIDEIVNGEQFAAICDGKAILGKRSGEIVVIERIIEKIL